MSFFILDCGIKDFDCKIGDGTDYFGRVSQTKPRHPHMGIECQAWNVQTPHVHQFSDLGKHNYCRNTIGLSMPWCYTTDPSVEWDYCDVRDCSNCDNGKNIVFETDRDRQRQTETDGDRQIH